MRRTSTKRFNGLAELRHEQLEKEGRFDVDPEDDPPTIPLEPEDVDYLKTKRTSKIKRSVAYKLGERFLDEILRTNKLIIKIYIND